ncbi:MAG: hypothetical protein JSU96_20405 [Acidobacteriota bacterium]|nr:MAG: hypothetical protein JSU96_20405 [Acidobacteriota bacterium]
MSQERLERLKSLVAKRPAEPFPRYALALEYLKEEDGTSAITLFEGLINDHPEYVPTYFQFGQVLIDAGDSDRARQILEAGVAVALEQGDDHAASELTAALDSF